MSNLVIITHCESKSILSKMLKALLLVLVVGQCIQLSEMQARPSKFCKNPNEMCVDDPSWEVYACPPPSTCCCLDDLVGKDAHEYCKFLARDLDNTPNDWLYPFMGRHPNPPASYTKEQMIRFRCWSFHYCSAFHKGGEEEYYRFTPVGWNLFGDADAFKTNKLRITKRSIAQEGVSFCIVGRHYRRSKMALWAPLKGFLALAEHSFDIGNHIDPDDPTKMNRFDLPNPEHLYNAANNKKYMKDECEKNTKYCWPRKNKVREHEFENVFIADGYLGRLPKLVEGFRKRPAHPDYMPDEDCRNPYVVEVDMIEADGLPLHNYLHITVKTRPGSTSRGKRCPTGKMKLLMLEVRDQNGFPVGQFTDDIPCDRDEKTFMQELTCPTGVTCKRYTGRKQNHVPCMYTHPKSTVHPTIFMMSAADVGVKGGVVRSYASEPTSKDEDFCRDSFKPKHSRKPPEVQYKENANDYFTEVHTTWRFAQMNNGWISELHFATLIIEDTTPIQYYTGRLTQWAGAETQTDDVQSCRSWTEIFLNEEGVRVCLAGKSVPTVYDNQCCRHYRAEYAQSFRKSAIKLALINACVNKSWSTNRPYGYSAQYQAIKPTFRTQGGWDYFQKRYIPPEDVNCHVGITYGPEYFYEKNQESGSSWSLLPVREGLTDFINHTYCLEETKRYRGKFVAYDSNKRNWIKISSELKHRREDANVYLCDLNKEWSGYWTRYNPTDIDLSQIPVYELPDWHVLGFSRHNGPDDDSQFRHTYYYGHKPEVAAKKMFRSAHQDPVMVNTEFPDEPAREYFGTRHLLSRNSPDPPTDVGLREAFGEEQKYPMKDMGLDPRLRCPCSYFPTMPPPELRTKTSKEIDGRQIHVVNMTIAWMIMVPLAFFIARFFKETYSKVFFLQEFWWYTIHVLCLLTGLLFTFGGVYGLKLKRDEGYQLVWTTSTAIHIYGSYVLIPLYIIQLVFGACRFYNVEMRMIQIGLHWGFGWMTYLLAIVIIISTIGIPYGMMNCISLGIYVGFIGFQFMMTFFMEHHMRNRSDARLNLIPPRQYFPTPMMRVFHKDAPHSKFRIVMLLVFVFGSMIFYGALHLTMRLPGGEVGCFQPTAHL